MTLTVKLPLTDSEIDQLEAVVGKDYITTLDMIWNERIHATGFEQTILTNHQPLDRYWGHRLQEVRTVIDLQTRFIEVWTKEFTANEKIPADIRAKVAVYVMEVNTKLRNTRRENEGGVKP